MAATRRASQGSLRALTAAALVLPGLAPSTPRAAEDDEFTFQYGRYQEDERDLHGVDSDYEPIRADSLLFEQRVTLSDRWKLAVTYMQDTWSGATPVTTAPLVIGGNHPSSPDGVSGATPLIEGDLFLDSNLQPVTLDEFGGVLATDPRLVHTLSSASPETRMQGAFELGYDWSQVELDVGGGVSVEDDYESRFASVGALWQLEQSQTSFNLVLRFADSDTQALLDHDAVPYIDTRAFDGQIDVDGSGDRTLDGDRQDYGVQLGATQILSRNALIESSVAYGRSRGYLENPYKVVEVGFLDPEQQFLAPSGGYYAQVRALLEKRPNLRSQWTWDTRFVQYVEALGGSLHLGYRLYHDDWGLDAHTLEASFAQPLGSGWTVIPRVRYYSQDAADFYDPYLLSEQAFVTVVSDPDSGEIISVTPYDAGLLPSSYSSDQRLSGYGTLAGGLTVSKQFARGVVLEADFEYYRHQGRLKLGGGGEDDYADWDAYRVSAQVTVDSSALHAVATRAGERRAAHSAHAGGFAPAGVALDHMLPDAGELMLGYRYTLGRQAGDLLHGASSVGDAQVISFGCESDPCSTGARRMDMQMHMLEWMYAPSDWLNLMVMAQFVDMSMDTQALAGAPQDVHGSHDHATGGPGDTLGFVLVELAETETQRLHLGLGLSAPTGDVGEELRRTHQEDRGYIHYGMQLGSGTWDFLPSLTWTGALDAWSFGGQLSGVRRLESENRSGYALGDAFQATVWSGYALTDWLSVSLRGVYTLQGELRGEYDGLHPESGPMDFPDNYGGQFWDLGFGLSARISSGYLAGNRFALEWLEPIHDDVNGYQLERAGALFAVWSVDF
ncbi:MAG: DUF3570 domain-containing protein [Myxococcota bacterium]